MKLMNKQIVGPHHKPLVFDLDIPNCTAPAPLVIFCHGYKGFKDWGAWHLVSSAFAKAGFAFLKFNFAYNGGTPEQPIDFPDEDAFGKNRYSYELDDVGVILDYVHSNGFSHQNNINLNNITLIGHSRGGGIAILKAVEDTRIKQVITWAAVSDYACRMPRGKDLENWKKDNVRYIENSRTGQKLPHYYSFYTDLIENRSRLDIPSRMAALQQPALIIHGEKDPSVSHIEAHNLKSYNPKAQLLLHPGSDHVFGAKHPWKKDNLPEDLQWVIDESVKWLYTK